MYSLALWPVNICIRASFSRDEKIFYVFLNGETFGKPPYIVLVVEQYKAVVD
jgi:hypothetical protein